MVKFSFWSENRQKSRFLLKFWKMIRCYNFWLLCTTGRCRTILEMAWAALYSCNKNSWKFWHLDFFDFLLCCKDSENVKYLFFPIGKPISNKSSFQCIGIKGAKSVENRDGSFFLTLWGYLEAVWSLLTHFWPSFCF